MKTNIRSFIVLAVILLTTGFQHLREEKGKAVWSQFTSKEGAFSVLMPNKPTQAVEPIETELGKLDLHMSIGSIDDTEAFIVSYTDFPSFATDRDFINRILDGGRNQLLSKKERKLLSETSITLDGFAGRELAIDEPGGQILSRIYWVGRRLYQLIAINQKGRPDQGIVDRFFTSFKLVGDLRASIQQPTWTEFSLEEGGFSVLMPTKPLQQTLPAAESVNVHIYLSLGANGTGYLASYADLQDAPADQAQTIKALDDARNGQLKTSKGKLLRETTITIEGYPGRELKIEIATGEMITRILVVKQRLYQLLGIVPESIVGSEGSAQDVAKFLSSFKLTKR
jgi:hypothetical protein